MNYTFSSWIVVIGILALFALVSLAVIHRVPILKRHILGIE